MGRIKFGKSTYSFKVSQQTNIINNKVAKPIGKGLKDINKSILSSAVSVGRVGNENQSEINALSKVGAAGVASVACAGYTADITARISLRTYNVLRKNINRVKYVKINIENGVTFKKSITYMAKYSCTINRLSDTIVGVGHKMRSMGYTIKNISFKVKNMQHFMADVKNGKFKELDLKRISKRFALNSLRHAKQGGKTVAIGAGKASKKIVQGGTKAGISVVKASPTAAINLAQKQGSDDMAVQGVKFQGELTKATYKVTKNTTKVTYKAGKKIVKKTYSGIKSASTAINNAKKSKNTLWVQQHLNGAGKTTLTKIQEKAKNKMAKLGKAIFTNPLVVTGILIFAVFFLFVGGASAAVAGTVGGVIEFVQELVEGLIELVETIGDAILNFFEDVVDWVKGLFSDDGDVLELVDVDIGDEVDVHEYLLGCVQILKTQYILEQQEFYQTFLDNGYTEIKMYNYWNDEIITTEFNNETLGMLDDETYVQLISPVFKAILLGVYGEDFSSERANEVVQNCFIAITRTAYAPDVDLDNDYMTAEYEYCDGSTSYDANSENIVVRAGKYNYYNCNNMSKTYYHNADNSLNAQCDTFMYKCNGHLNIGYDITNETDNSHMQLYNSDIHKECSNYILYAKCLGHSDNVTFCKGNDFCTNQKEVIYYHDFKANNLAPWLQCDNLKTVNYNGIIKYVCGGHNQYVCGGHSQLTYDFEGYKEVGRYNSALQLNQGISIVGDLDNGDFTTSIQNQIGCDNFEVYIECQGHEYIRYDYTGVKYEKDENCDNQEEIFECAGYQFCHGHAVMNIYLGWNGFEDLIDFYFDDRIEELKEKQKSDGLNDAEEKELNALINYRDFAYEIKDAEDEIYLEGEDATIDLMH